MKKLSANSKLGQHFVEAYNWSTRYTLEDAYIRPSTAKQAAFERCRRVCEAENGYRLKVISANCQTFTVAFQVKTGLRVITLCNDYFIAF